jgi:mono/diheme cytochrome c family protein
MRKTLLTMALLVLGGCNYWYNNVPSPDDLMHNIPWFDHMLMSKSLQPYQSAAFPRNTPAGAVPVGGGEADWHSYDPANLQYAFDTLVANKVVRPTTPPRSDSRGGAEVFNTYCAVCHGLDAKGNGPVREMLAPSLLTPQVRGYTDGYVYSIIRFGRGRMPRYGDKIVRPDERWAVVDYVRSMESGAGVTAPTPSTKSAPRAKGAH